MNKQQVELAINRILHERLFIAIKKIGFKEAKDKFCKTLEYKNSNPEAKKQKTNVFFKKYYKDRENFYLSIYSIIAMHPLVKREEQIEEFASKEIFRVRASYVYNDSEFSVRYPTAFTADMQREIDDCVIDLKSSKHKHTVENFIPITDAEKAPPYPLTNAQIKNNVFYLFNFDPSLTTSILNKLYNVGLISDPNTNGWHINDDFAEEMITILNQQKFGESKVLQYKRKFGEDKIDRSKEAIIPRNISEDYFPKYINDTPEFRRIDFEAGEVDVAKKNI